MMQWAVALAPPRSPGGRLGLGCGQGRWPWWPEQALGGLGEVCGMAAALHRAPERLPELLAFLAGPWCFTTCFPMDKGLCRRSTKSRCRVNLAASACGKEPVTNISCFPHVQTSALVTRSWTCTTSHLLLSLFAGKAIEGGWGGMVGWEALGLDQQ